MFLHVHGVISFAFCIFITICIPYFPTLCWLHFSYSSLWECLFFYGGYIRHGEGGGGVWGSWRELASWARNYKSILYEFLCISVIGGTGKGSPMPPLQLQKLQELENYKNYKFVIPGPEGGAGGAIGLPISSWQPKSALVFSFSHLGSPKVL